MSKSKNQDESKEHLEQDFEEFLESHKIIEWET